MTDFSINAMGTLVLLEAARNIPPTPFSFLPRRTRSTATLPTACRWLKAKLAGKSRPITRTIVHGIDENLTIDQSKHSLFGASKVAADVLVQEYGRYFGMKTGVFRGGCLTGGGHCGTELHGFLSYLSAAASRAGPIPSTVTKANRSATTFTRSIWSTCSGDFCQAPRPGEVYNAGGSRHSHCSMLEAINLCEEVSGNKLKWQYSEARGPVTTSGTSAT